MAQWRTDGKWGMGLVVEAGLLVLYAQFAIHSGEDTLYLSHCKHTSEERIASIMSVVALIEDAARLVCECHAMIHTHRETSAGIAFAFHLCLFEDAA